MSLSGVDGRTPVPGGDHDVEVVRWPDGEGVRAVRRREGRATLLLVGPSRRPPATLGPLEDWLREPYDPADLHARREGLRRRLDVRAPAAFGDDGLLHRGRRWVDLSPAERRLVLALLGRQGTPVARRDLVAAVYGGPATGTDRALDALVRRARVRVAPLGLAIDAVRGLGYLLQVRDLPG